MMEEKAVAAQNLSGAFVPVAPDEAFSFRTKIDFEKIDRPSGWEVNQSGPKGRYVTKVRRILAGPVATQTIYLPTRGVDENGHPKATKTPITVPREGADFVVPEEIEIADQIDIEIKTALGYDLSEAQRPFRGGVVFRYLVFVKDGDDPMEVRLAEYPISVKDGIRELQHKLHPNKRIRVGGGDAPALLHGPYLLYEVFITKLREAGKDQMKGTKYSVEAAPENKWSGALPNTVYETGFPANFNWSAVFSAEEQAAIAAFLETNHVPTLQAYLEKITKEQEASRAHILTAISNLNPDAKEKGVPVFPNPVEFATKFQERLGIKLLATQGAPSDAPSDDLSVPVAEEVAASKKKTAAPAAVAPEPTASFGEVEEATPEQEKAFAPAVKEAADEDVFKWESAE
jgi:hypothetical protein